MYFISKDSGACQKEFGPNILVLLKEVLMENFWPDKNVFKAQQS